MICWLKDYEKKVNKLNFGRSPVKCWSYLGKFFQFKYETFQNIFYHTSLIHTIVVAQSKFWTVKLSVSTKFLSYEAYKCA